VSDAAVAALKVRLTALLPEAQITDYRETNPALTEGLDRATSLLSLMSLVALVLGAVGVAMAMRAHLQQRLDTIAIMKSLGARSGQIMKIYLLQTLLLGLAGGLLGVLLGVAVQLAFPLVLGKLINVPTQMHLQWRAIFAGLGAGMLTTLLFTLPPLLDIRGVRPSMILRRDTESDFGDDGGLSFVRRVLARLPWVALALVVTVVSVVVVRRHSPGHALELLLEGICLFSAAGFGPMIWDWVRREPMQAGSFLLILAGIAVIATTLSDSSEVGRVFSVGLAIVLLVLLAASAAVLWGLKFFLNRTRLHLPSALRHGLANLYRPGNPSAALLAALGMGVMQMMTVYLVQRAVVDELHIASAPNMPNVFLVDIAQTEIEGIRAVLKAQPGVTTQPELVPMVAARVESVDGGDGEAACAGDAAEWAAAHAARGEPDLGRGGPGGDEGGVGRVVEGGRTQGGACDLRAAGGVDGGEAGIDDCVCSAGYEDRGDRGGSDQRRWAARLRTRAVHAAESCAGRAARGVGRRRACDAGAGGRAATRAVCGVSHGDGDQCGAGSGDSARGGDPGYVCDPVSGGVLDLRGSGDSGVFDCGDEVPADARGGGVEDAGRDAWANCRDLLD
jgi:hypothetical protein